MPVVEAGYQVPSNFNSLPRATFSNQSGDDSGRLRTLIRDNRSTGAIITFLNSNTPYELGNINLEDNIHIRFNDNVHILQSAQGNVFRLAGENTSVVGRTNSRAVIEAMRSGRIRFRAALATSLAQNFLIQSLNIIEKRTTFTPIETTGTSANGTIRNITVQGEGSTGGWGLLQMQGGRNIDLINLNGLGGYTARLEQNEPFGRRYDDIVGRNLICRNGRAPIALFPNQPNGSVDFRRLRGNRSAFSADLGGRSSNDFSSLRLINVQNAYGIRNAQYRNFSNDQVPRLVPTPLRSNIISREGPFVDGPSIGGVRISPTAARIATVSNVRISRFPQRFYRYRDSNGTLRNMPPILTSSVRAEMVADSER